MRQKLADKSEASLAGCDWPQRLRYLLSEADKKLLAEATTQCLKGLAVEAPSEAAGARKSASKKQDDKARSANFDRFFD